MNFKTRITSELQDIQGIVQEHPKEAVERISKVIEDLGGARISKDCIKCGHEISDENGLCIWKDCKCNCEQEPTE